ncbi:restriction endonuclease subunit S [Enterococcus raffinosus]|uniref:restriction endonuclease subunit S n=1 Tax=Enterococcus raffinosus TaxID=71452 RepID=UPI0035E0F83B
MIKIDKKKYPTLRFPEFTDDWELRKLGELAIFSKGNGYTKNDLTEKGNPIVLYGRLYTKYETVINEVDTFVEMKDKSVVSQGNEVVVPASGETAEDISRASVVGTKGLILGGDLNIIKLNNEINSIFLALTISNGTQQKEMIKRAQGKSVVHLHNSDLKQLNLLYPNFEEQSKIGSFFKQFDEAIALHQRKLDLLKEQKKGYLQKMFPKNGAKVPELRFAGFADDWDVRKFGELYKKVNEKNDLSFGKDRVISVANMYFKDTGNIRSDDAYMKTYNIFRTGDIAFEGNRSKHFAYGRFVENTIGDGIVSHVFDVFRPIQQFDLNYWKYAIHNERVMGPILMTATTSSTMMTNLVAKDFLKRAILVPSYSEQETIGSFFKQLDDNIALHQRKLDLLKEQKKGFLQKMFV